MRRTPRPHWDRAVGRVSSWDPETTRRISWGAVAVIASALVWPLLVSDGEVRSTPSSLRTTTEVVGPPATADSTEPDCVVVDQPQDPPPPGLAAVSTSVVGRNAIVESIRWAQRSRAGLWGVAAVAECGAVRLDAVWVGPTGQKRRHNVSHTGRPVIGVVADGLDGAISVYTVRGGAGGSLSATLHISTDLGVTWQQRAVPPSAEPHVRAGVLPPSWQEWSVLAS
ncbi:MULTISPECIES: hypothetical protein [unclassified Knoellia]|uniref:hypothetical protein n=1 Tax=Knoellia altitudinis TaxID=3404795 RepID=UPI00361962B4